jgi:hypothetical protein
MKIESTGITSTIRAAVWMSLVNRPAISLEKIFKSKTNVETIASVPSTHTIANLFA